MRNYIHVIMFFGGDLRYSWFVKLYMYFLQVAYVRSLARTYFLIWTRLYLNVLSARIILNVMW